MGPRDCYDDGFSFGMGGSRPSRGADAIGMRTDLYNLPEYEAEKQHEQQDDASGASNAAMRIIQSRLNNR